MSTLNSSTQLQQFGVMSVTTVYCSCSMFYWLHTKQNYKGAHHHLLYVDAALVKSAKANRLCIISYTDQL